MLIIVLVVPMRNITYELKAIFICPIYTFGITSTIVDGLKVPETPSFDGNLFRNYTTPSISDIVIIIIHILNLTVWYIDISCPLIVNIDRSIIPKCSLFEYMCIKALCKDVSIFFLLKPLSPW